MNTAQRQFTTHVLMLEADRVWKARMRVQDATYALRLAEHEVEIAKFELELNPLVQEVARIGDDATKWINTKSPYHFVYPR